MISVPYTFQKTFHYEINQGKNVDVQWGTDSTVYRKYPSLAKNQDDQCSSPDTADHPFDTPRLLLLPYLVRQIFGHDGKKQITIEKRKSTKDKTKKTTCRRHQSEINVVIFRRPLSNCLLCRVDDAVVRSWRIVGLADSSRTAAC